MEKVEKDFVELFQSLNRNRVRYCIIGAFAVAFHAIPRYTKDIDVLIDPSAENAVKVATAIEDFGFSSLGLSADDLCGPGHVIQLGFEPVRVAFLTSVEGCDFETIWKGRKKGMYGSQRVNFVGLNELIRMKKKAARKQDLADLEILEKKKKRQGVRKSKPVR